MNTIEHDTTWLVNIVKCEGNCDNPIDDCHSNCPMEKECIKHINYAHKNTFTNKELFTLANKRIYNTAIKKLIKLHGKRKAKELIMEVLI